MEIQGVEENYFEGENSLIKYNGQVVWFCMENGMPMVLFPVPSIEATQLEPIGNIKFSFSIFSVNGSESESYLTLELNSETEADILFAFVRALSNEIGDARSINDLYRVVAMEYKIWSDFFGSGKIQNQELTSLIGLFGELTFLEILISKGITNSLSQWWGPFRNRHDFEFADHVFEIKSTLNISKNEIVVHGLDQLTDDNMRKLSIVFSKFVPTAKGRNIGELIDSLLCLGLSEVELRSKLSKSGFSLERIERVSHLRFECLDTTFYDVDDKFPRLQSSDLKQDLVDRIRKVDYILDLSGLKSYKLSEGVFDLGE